MEYTRFNLLKNESFNPKRILDIGAHQGKFSEKLKKEYFPNSDYLLIEANPFLKDQLETTKFNYLIQLLGSEDKNNVEYFITNKWYCSSGNSIYKENTEDYDDDKLVVIHLDMKKLDTIFNKNDVFDLIKLDTQGSELEIIKGGLDLIKRTKYLLIETSIIEYNIGGCKSEELISFLHSINFGIKDIFDLNFTKNGTLMQVDFLFYNKNIL